MYTRDYIMRMIEQLAQVLARAVFHKNLFDYPKALDEVRLGGKNLVGIDWGAFTGLSDKDMIEIVRVPATDDARIYSMTADLLVAEAEIRSLQENDDLAWMRNVCAFSLYCETLKVIPSEEIERKAEVVLRLVEGYELPPWIEEKRTAFLDKSLFATAFHQT